MYNKIKKVVHEARLPTKVAHRLPWLAEMLGAMSHSTSKGLSQNNSRHSPSGDTNLTMQHQPTLEIHIPISPTPKFENMTHFFVESLRIYGGAYRNSKVVVTSGAEPGAEELRSRSWIKDNKVEVRIVNEKAFNKHSIYATAIERFLHPFTEDVVFMLDADILIARPFDNLVNEVWRSKNFFGLIAHISPLPENMDWNTFFQKCGQPAPRTPNEHTGWGYMFNDPSKRFCPAYFNLGSLCAPSSTMNLIGQELYPMMEAVDGVYETYYKCQLALALAIEKLRVPYTLMPMRYNYPNSVFIEAIHQGELQQACILHMLAENQGINKESVFGQPGGIDMLLGRQDLRNANSLMQQVVAASLPGVRASGGPHV